MTNETGKDNKAAYGALATTRGDFKAAGDWVNRLMAEHCTVVLEPGTDPVAAVEEQKDGEGNVIVEAVAYKAGRKPRTGIDLELLHKLADDNNIVYKDYPNVGMARMNIGNMLRAAARKRHGLYVNGEWQNAPADFQVNETVSQNRDGSRVKPAKAEAVENAEAAA